MITKIKKIIRKFKIEVAKIRFESTDKFEGTELKYLLMREKNSDYLLIVFSAFPNINRPAGYNYVDTFKDIKCNKLYILDDFGPNIRGGSYYLGKEKNFFIQSAVDKLIESISNDLNIEKRNIITTGTSKGGYASLYFSFKNSYGHAISGAPQIFLGDYLSNHKIFFEYIIGEYNEENKKYLNCLLFNAVKENSIFPNVHFHVGEGDHHYPEHVLPFIKYLDSENLPYTLDIQKYDGHADVGKYYPKFAIKQINEIIKSEHPSS